MIIVDLYSSNHCSLCEKAKETLLIIQKEIPFVLKEIKIKETDQFYSNFKERIPVIFIEGKEVLSGKINEQEIRKYLTNKIL